MPLLDRYEPFIAWRYLYRRRRSPALLVLTLIFFTLALLAHLGVFMPLGHDTQIIAMGFSQPMMLLFLFFLLLNFFSGFTTVSIIGVAIGVQALITVLSVTSGFQQSFKQKVLGVNAHIIVMKYGQDFSEYGEVEAKALKEKHVLAAAPFVFYEGMLAAGTSMSGADIKGIDPKLSPAVLAIGTSLKQGKVSDLALRLPPNGGGKPLPAIFLGEGLAKKLKVKLGDRVRVISPKAALDPSAWSGSASGGSTSTAEFRLAGLSYTGFDEYDRHLAYVSLKDAQDDFETEHDTVTGVELKLDDIDKAAGVAKTLYEDLGGPPYHVIDWLELNHNLFAALKMQKVALTVILTLIVIVAAFNIIAAMTLLVLGKHARDRDPQVDGDARVGRGAHVSDGGTAHGRGGDRRWAGGGGERDLGAAPLQLPARSAGLHDRQAAGEGEPRRGNADGGDHLAHLHAGHALSRAQGGQALARRRPAQRVVSARRARLCRGS